jgi:uncharacterized protein
MTGTFVNAAAIIVGSLMGILLKKGLPDRLKGTLMQGLGLGVLLIGFRMAFQSENLLIVLASLVLGGIVGETINIELYLEKFGLFIQSKVDENSSIAKAFVTSSLLYCVGSMAVMGALESGLTGNHTTLYAKSILDGVTSIIFASTLGIGVLFSAIPVLAYQGAITLAATLVQPILTTAAVAEMTGTGGLLIIGIGLNVLEIKTIKVGNLLPAILFALLISTIVGLF